MADVEVNDGDTSHLRRRYSASRPTNLAAPDETQTSSSPPANTDPDTCRICRGEPTVTEPLFYPCKCSGSIKYVHQNCLMEWLSHSQKKHCELCKTPFRFTKLYSHKMPKSLPTHIFIGHMAKYMFDNVVSWLRALLVACVWLCWLPYLMRRVWCLLFWLSDEGLVSLFGKPDAAAFNITGEASSNANSTTAAPLATLISAAANLSGQSAAIAATNSTGQEPISLLSIVWKSMLPPFLRASPLGRSANDTANTSLLSDVGFLRNMTRHPAVNRAVIMIIEGQVLTISVIACFILIILVRDYVVQQQPEINMRAAFAPQENAENARQEDGEANPAPPMAVPEQGVPEAQDPPRPHQEPQQEPQEEGDDRDQEGDARTPFDDDAAAPNYVLPEQRPIAPFRRRLPRPDSHQEASGPGRPGSERLPDDNGGSSSSGPPAPPQNGGPGRPSPRDQQLPTVQEYLRIYRQAEGDPETILRIMEEENLQDRLGHWVKVTRSRLDDDGASTAAGGGVDGSPQGHRQHDFSSTRAEDGLGDGGSATLGSESLRGNEGLSDQADAADSAPSGIVESTGPRRRAVSDGPQPRQFPHPLANNNWQLSHDTDDETERSRLSPPAPLSFTPNQARTGAGPGLEDGESVLSTATERGSVSSNRSDTTSVFSGRDFGGEWDERHPDTTDDGDEGGQNRAQHARATDNDDEDIRPAADAEPGSPTDTPLAEDSGQVVEPPPPPPPPPPPLPPLPPLRRRFLDLVADFLLGGVEEEDINDVAAEVPDNGGAADDLNGFAAAAQDVVGGLLGDNNVDRDAEAVDAAMAAAGLDADALEDLEDFEGILELIGIRGPIIGLFQNAVFCAGLVFVAIFICIFLPYNLGRTAIWLVANPMRIVRMLFALASFVQDIVVVVAGSLSCVTLSVVHFLGRGVGWSDVASTTNTSLAYTWELTANSSSRLASGFLAEVPIQPSEIQNFSAVSHDALISLKTHIASVLAAVWSALTFVFGTPLSEMLSNTTAAATNATVVAKDTMWNSLAILTNPGTWIINLDEPAAILPVNPYLAHWDGIDRFWAIAGGYASLAVAAAIYVRRSAPFFAGEVGQEWEASIIDLINQASGVTKVILIIGIEMLVFPLYCGLLLDAALLPLFKDATVMSRIEFSMKHPTTSIFVHWFVGTGYMFHFALFVSMCRKIMRRGVLYFIRDPDDPDFHPIRDVLEKPFLTQLRKILFSGLIYGGLVMVCLGGVVWGLRASTTKVLPIHYSSNEPVLEFPVDLLFYNFLMPLAVKVLRPSDALHAMYTWWFKKCARMLRLTWFLFGQRQIDEEGFLVLPADSPHRKLPWFRRIFLGLDADGNVAPKSFLDLFKEAASTGPSTSSALDVDADDEDTDAAADEEGADGAEEVPDPLATSVALADAMKKLVESGQLVKSGRFVRTPASDQVRIPRGRKVFFELDENSPPQPPPDPNDPPYLSELYQTVYIPPRFGVRVILFIVFIWVFAAVTGVGLTIVPLLAGRWMFKHLLPSGIGTNDIYAFSIGIYMMGASLYTAFHMGSLMRKVRDWVATAGNTLFGENAVRRTARAVTNMAKLAYTYVFLLIVCPVLASLLVEFYVIIPLHTWMYPPTWDSTPKPEGMVAAAAEQSKGAMTAHTIRAVQTWTLGLLYMKLATRVLINNFGGTRLARACRAVFHVGWLRPNVGVLTRAFVFPGLTLSAIALGLPPLLMRLILRRELGPDWATSDPAMTAFMYRISFMLAAAFVISFAVVYSLVGVFHGWQTRIRDEVYLIGERLHNYGVATAGTVKVREG